jgi:hypothetical protein
VCQWRGTMILPYRSMICQHIRPKWGDAYLEDVRPALVRDWLRRLVLSPKYKGHIRSPYWTVLDSRCKCPIARNLMMRWLRGVDLNHGPLGYENDRIQLTD